MWTVDYEEDIESDLSAFHRIDDPMGLPGPRYFMLAARLGAYAGVIQARALAEREKSEGRQAAPAATVGGRHAAASAEQPTRTTDTAAIAMLSLDGWVEHERGDAA